MDETRRDSIGQILARLEAKGKIMDKELRVLVERVKRNKERLSGTH